MLINELASLNNNEIFSKIETSIAYCRWLGKGWSVYKVPGRESFTVCRTKDMYNDTRVTYNVYTRRPQRDKFDPRWVIFST